MNSKPTLMACLAAMLVFSFTSPAHEKISLNGKWDLEFWEQEGDPVTDPAAIAGLKTTRLSATVPGNVELDLLAAGMIENPEIGNNIYKLRPYEFCQWMYSRHFTAPSLVDGQRLILDFEGIDCIADIWLNGEKIGSADDALIAHRFDVTGKAKAGDNLLQVVLRSAVLEAQKELVGTYSFRHYTESVWIRKPRHCYGWDIMPRLVSAGLWRDVSLIVQDPVSISDVHWVTVDTDPATGNVSAFVDVQVKYPASKIDKVKLHVKLEKDGSTAYEMERILPTFAWRTEFKLDKAELWWPKGYGDPALYDGTVSIVDEDGTVLASDTRKVGFRTVRLDRSEMIKDGEGEFSFFINGERIFVRGTNWVPLDGFHSRDARWVDSTLDMVVDLNCNMIRCWGGNVYEDTPFYDRCDREGIMVWQDFSMAGVIYPQDDRFVSKLRNEIKQVVIKFRGHPSLAIWSGNNENDNSLLWTLPTFHIDPNRDVISRKMIPEVLYEFDPTRPYLPSSPYFSEEAFQNGCQRSDLPQDHLWGPRGYYKDPFYKDAQAIFVSEIGYHGAPNKESVEKMFTKDCRYPWTRDGDWNEEWMTKSVRPLPFFVEFEGRNDLMTKQINLLFGFRPKTLEDFIAASQSTQAEAMKYFVEKFRGERFRRTGIIWWNVRDGWPIVSDAIVDYYNSKKLAYSYLWNAQRTVCVLINDEEEGVLPLRAVNDSFVPAEGKVKVTDVESGKVIYNGKFSVGSNDRSLVAGLPVPHGQGVLLIEYETGGQKFRNHYLYGAPPFDFRSYQRWLKEAGLVP
ncbi:MAG: glycoside hydrolase family 2 [Bacteroidales bacterium]|nr:glycoside hydrolase family 2 [Bacteroidales bacterium]